MTAKSTTFKWVNHNLLSLAYVEDKGHPARRVYVILNGVHHTFRAEKSLTLANWFTL